MPPTLASLVHHSALKLTVRAGEDRLDVPVRLVDERFSTVGAQRGLHASGVDTRRGRSVIDQAAAVIILQGALDAERSSGLAPGRLVQAVDPTGRTVKGEQ